MSEKFSGYQVKMEQRLEVLCVVGQQEKRASK
jgi:hypothetical protein